MANGGESFLETNIWIEQWNRPTKVNDPIPMNGMFLHMKTFNRKSNDDLMVVDPNTGQPLQKYTIQDDCETLNNIAARFDTTPSYIKSLNRLDGDHVFVGQNLMIPAIHHCGLD